MHEVQFEANEYVSICVSTNSLKTGNWWEIFTNGYLVFTYKNGDETKQINNASMPQYNDDTVLYGDKTYNSGTLYELDNVKKYTFSIMQGGFVDSDVTAQYKVENGPNYYFESKNNSSYVFSDYSRTYENQAVWS